MAQIRSRSPPLQCHSHLSSLTPALESSVAAGSSGGQACALHPWCAGPADRGCPHDGLPLQVHAGGEGRRTNVLGTDGREINAWKN